MKIAFPSFAGIASLAVALIAGPAMLIPQSAAAADDAGIVVYNA